MKKQVNSTKRFSNRVKDYVKYRPGYPIAIVDYLEQQHYLEHADTIADIGAGTGISSKLFLDKGYRVVAVEPNDDMREMAIALLGNLDLFSIVNGTAAHTSLADHSIDLVVMAQAFHWFNNNETKKELLRILKTQSIVVLLWNERLTSTNFEKEYEQLIIRHATDYTKVDHRQINLENINRFFAPNVCEEIIFANHQDFDFKGLEGRLMSSSYVPARNEAGYEAMINDLRSLYERYQQNNTIRINYDTKMYVGHLTR